MTPENVADVLIYTGKGVDEPMSLKREVEDLRGVTREGITEEISDPHNLGKYVRNRQYEWLLVTTSVVQIEQEDPHQENKLAELGVEDHRTGPEVRRASAEAEIRVDSIDRIITVEDNGD